MKNNNSPFSYFFLFWLISMMGLSFGSGYQLPQAGNPVPFDPGAIFLTPYGILVHFMEQPQGIYELYFRDSVREGITDNFWFLLLVILNTVVAYICMIRVKA